MSEMVERIARAIWSKDELMELDGESWDDCPMKDMLREQARAAIEAMRECTKAMEAAGETKIGRGPMSALVLSDPAEIWQAMLDAALDPLPSIERLAVDHG